MPCADTTTSVLYRFWYEATPPRLEYLSAGAEELMEATADELTTMMHSCTLPLVGIDEAAFYASSEQSMRDHSSWQTEFGYVGPRTGRVRWFQGADFPQVAADGSRYFLGSLLDVTARREAAQAEREAANRLAAHMANTPLAVIEWDTEFRVTRWTEPAEAMFGWTADEVMGKTPNEFSIVHPADVERVEGVCNRLRTGVERRSVVFNRNLHKSGRVLECEWHNSVLFDDTGAVKSVLSLAHDRTPQAAAQALLVKSEARLRACLHHAHMLGWEHDLKTNTVHYSGDRAAFYGGEDDDDPTVNVVHPTDRERVVRAIETAAATGMPLAVEYRGLTRTADGRPRWFIARGQVDADFEGRPTRAVGVTSEITDRVHSTEDRAGIDRQLWEANRRPASPTVVHTLSNALTVALSSLHQASERLGSHPASGLIREAIAACERIAETIRRPTTPTPSSTGWRATGRALVADDEPNIRELVAVLLEEAGFTVTRAADGPSALAAFRADPTDYRLAVVDILMPGLEGDSLVAQLRAIRPGLPAVLATGFLTRPIDPNVLHAPATRLLHKPFRVEHLLAATQAVYSASQTTASTTRP